MLTIEHTKELLNDPTLSDKDVEEIRDSFRVLSEIIFEVWQEERRMAKEKQGVQNHHHDH